MSEIIINEEEKEVKYFPFELKEATKEGQFSGYAAIFDKPDLMGEIIEKGAFTKTLKKKDFFTMCWAHDTYNPIGIANLIEDKKGLKVQGEMNLEVQLAREKYSLMKQKAIRGLSIGFKTLKDAWIDSKRFIKEIELYEISPVTFQAQPKALISAVKQRPKMIPQSIEGAVEYLEKELKSGKMISAANLKLINNAVGALVVILKKLEPSKDTQDDKKDLFSPIIEALETTDKPSRNLSDEIRKALEEI